MTTPPPPYTEADLRAEAARQHAGLTEDPEFMCVGESMQDTAIPSTSPDPDAENDTGRTWGEVLPYQADDGDGYNAAQRKIHTLISHAADVSEWAVNLGADDLIPAGHVLTVGAADKPLARIHFAFPDHVDDTFRTGLVTGLGQCIADALGLNAT